MNKKILMAIVVLIIIVGVTAYLNQDSIADKKEMQENALVSIQENGEEMEKVSLEQIVELGEVTFDKELDTSDSDPVLHTYTGIPLINLIEEAGVDLADKTQVIVKAADGYTVAMSLEEVREEDNVYLVYKEDGEYLKGKSEGGSGPLKTVIRKDQFGQRWCKFLIEVNVK
ncbi:MAG: molybdopterin-dependent oxidoreductase [Halanaerobiaceae bacterium]